MSSVSESKCLSMTPSADLTNPPADMHSALLQEIIKPEFQGVRCIAGQQPTAILFVQALHVKLMMSYPDRYRIKLWAAQRLIRAFFLLLWNKDRRGVGIVGSTMKVRVAQPENTDSSHAASPANQAVAAHKIEACGPRRLAHGGRLDLRLRFRVRRASCCALAHTADCSDCHRAKIASIFPPHHDYSEDGIQRMQVYVDNPRGESPKNGRRGGGNGGRGNGVDGHRCSRQALQNGPGRLPQDEIVHQASSHRLR